MASDRARVSYDPSREWRGVIAQQGRVSVEADWNEAATIAEERDRHVTLDVVGPVGTPDSGYAVTAVPAEGEQAESTPGHFTIGKGTLYLGGERLDLDEQVHYRTQPDWLDHSTDPLWDPPAVRDRKGGRHELVYLLASEQEVSAVEDPALADVALGGPDTMQRRRILQRFARYPSESGTCDGSRSALERSLADHGLKLDPASMMAESTAKLQVSFPNSPAAPRISRPVPGGGYLGAENQMIRVMVTGTGGKNGEPTIVWGFDDASFLYRVQPAAHDSEGTTLTLASAPVDSYHYPEKGQAVELLRDAVKLTDNDYIASSHGFVSALAGAYDPTSKQLVISGEPPSGYLSDETPQLYLRVWQATALAPTGKPILLGDTGVAVTLTTSGSFHVGDFWRFALRPIQPATVYPERYRSEPQPPDGPRIWACPLAVLTWDDEEHVRASSCIPQFSGLAEMAGRKGGCCTVDVGPRDVDDGASLQALLDGYAHRGPVTVCLEPGTYTLRAPLVLGPELDGITLQACREHVVLQAPRRPGEEFVFGLIAIRDAASVTIRGVELALPHIRFSPAERSFSGLRRRNHELLRDFSRGLHVAIGISVQDSVDLAVEDCTFLHPDPGGANSFCAGIFATGAIEGVEITGCAFQPVSPSTTDQRRRRRGRWSADRARAVPFHELATGGKFDSTHQLSFGYLQVPTFGSDRKVRPHRLDDATMEQCLFQGITVPALVMAHIGPLRVNRNTVRSSYGGFWFVSLADPELCVIFDRIAVGDADAYREISGNRGGAALLDRILVIAAAIGQVLPAPHPAGGRPAASRLLIPDAALLALARQTFSDFYTQGAESGELPREIDALFRNLDTEEPEADLPVAEEESGRFRSSHRDLGGPLSLRLDLADCQVDDIIGDSRCGAGLLVADFTAEAGSVLLHDNRIRSRFPGGETVFIGGIGEACVTGNVIANEVEHELNERKSHSLGLVLVTTPAVAITGNVFIDPPRLPERHSTSQDAHLEPWHLLNTVIDYVPQAERRERAERPGREFEREELEEPEESTHIIPSVPTRSALGVRITEGADAGRTFDLAQGEQIIGRGARSEIQLEDPVVSISHAILRVSGENVTIEDLHSTNGTKVNDVAVEREIPVAPGDEINVGGVKLVVEQHQATSPDES